MDAGKHEARRPEAQFSDGLVPPLQTVAYRARLAPLCQRVIRYPQHSALMVIIYGKNRSDSAERLKLEGSFRRTPRRVAEERAMEAFGGPHNSKSVACFTRRFTGRVRA